MAFSEAGLNIQISLNFPQLPHNYQFLQNVEALKGFTYPKFWFGQAVVCTWLCEDLLDEERYGKTFNDYGFIVGMSFDLPDAPKQWLYNVCWISTDSGSLQKYPLFDTSPEKELAAI